MLVVVAVLLWLHQALLLSASISPTLSLLAEFVTVDYKWDATHRRSVYEETGQFIVGNNAITGVKVSKSGDIFVTVPRWLTGVPSSLNKLVQNPYGSGYVLDPWPSWEFNALNVPGALQYAQSMIIDSQNRMWIPDVGRLNIFDAPSLVVNGPAGLFVVNVSTGETLFTYSFPNEVVPYNNSFVNDIVLDEVNGWAYFSNTLAQGGIIVYDIKKSTSHMFIGPSTYRNSSYNVCVNDYCYGTDGFGANPSDGIALSADGHTLYWSPVQGKGVYSINTSYLHDFSMTNEEFESHTVYLGSKAGISDGLLLVNGNLYFGDNTISALGVIDSIASYDTVSSLDATDSSQVSETNNEELEWFDTFAPDLANPLAYNLYATTNRLDRFFNGTMDFTGQSGSNFRVYYITDLDSTSSSSSSAKFPWYDIFIVIVVVLIVCFVVYLFLHHYMGYWQSDEDTLVHQGQENSSAGAETFL